MKRTAYGIFALLLLAGLGCSISDYPVITDRYTGEIVNTNGKATIMWETQYATTWSDGTDNLFTMVDQKANGDQVLPTYNYFTTDGSIWIDWDYCHPDWSGCIATISYNPVEGDDDIFDHEHRNCLGARSCCMIIAVAFRYNECGRAAMSAVDRAGLISSLKQTSPNSVGLQVNRRTAVFEVDNNAGRVDRIPIYGNVPVEVSFQAGRAYAAVDMSDPIFNNTLYALHDWVVRHQTGRTTLRPTYEGFDLGDYNVLFEPDRIADNARR